MYSNKLILDCFHTSAWYDDSPIAPNKDSLKQTQEDFSLLLEHLSQNEDMSFLVGEAIRSNEKMKLEQLSASKLMHDSQPSLSLSLGSSSHTATSKDRRKKKMGRRCSIASNSSKSSSDTPPRKPVRRGSIKSESTEENIIPFSRSSSRRSIVIDNHHRNGHDSFSSYGMTSQKSKTRVKDTETRARRRASLLGDDSERIFNEPPITEFDLYDFERDEFQQRLHDSCISFDFDAMMEDFNGNAADWDHSDHTDHEDITSLEGTPVRSNVSKCSKTLKCPRVFRE
jgi:hypothetical protein